MRTQIAVILLLSAFFICTGCTEKTPEAVVLRPEPYELPLSGLWDLTVNETAVENETAVFSDLKIRVGSQVSPEHILLKFWGEQEDRRNFYRVEMNSQGTVSWHSGESTDSFRETPHPLELLRGLEEIRLRELTFGEEGLDIELNGMTGDVSYEGRLNNNLFVLKNGGLIPLEMVRLSGANPWYPITICKRKYHNVQIKENKTPGESDIIFLPGKEAPCFTVFTEEALSKAEMVVYREKNKTVIFNPLQTNQVGNN